MIEFAKHEEGNNWSLMSQSVDTMWFESCDINGQLAAWQQQYRRQHKKEKHKEKER